MSKSDFVCPLLWHHVSCHPDGDLRVCCHGLGQNKIEAGLSIFDAHENVLNHETYKSLRREMLAGKVPKVCESCHHMEKLGVESPRERYVKSTGEAINTLIAETETDGTIERIPYEIDLTMGNACNFKCRMCSPVFSDKLQNTFDQLGFSYNRDSVSKIDERWNREDIEIPLLHSPYIESLIFQGGEPLVYRHHLDFLELLVNEGRAEKITLFYNTNLSILPKRCLDLWKNFKSVEVDISLDGVGKTFEYIRYESDWDKVKANILMLQSIRDINLSLLFSTLIQAPVIHGLVELIEFCSSLKEGGVRVPKFTLLESPDFLGLNACPKDVVENSVKELEAVDQSHFSAIELQHMQELLKLLDTHQFDPDLHFKFLAHTKVLDKHNSKAPNFFELTNPSS